MNAKKVVSVCLLVVALGPNLSAAESDAEELFVHRVLPTFKEKCFTCHGDDPTDLRGEFNMHSQTVC